MQLAIICDMKNAKVKMRNILRLGSRRDFRAWLEKNFDSKKECWLAVRRGDSKGPNALSYLDAVEEALCFGWIDSTLKKGVGGLVFQRFCPRRPRSRWSELNKERCRRLERLGMMTDAGRAVLPDMSKEGFAIGTDILQRLKSDRNLWENFCKLPDLYRRVRIDTIQIKRKQPELFRRRLEKFIENTRRRILYGKWNDGGRLS